MTTNEFEYIPINTGVKTLVKLEQDDEIIKVTMGDEYLGTMIEDPNAEFGYTTDNDALKSELEHLSMAIKENEALHNLPDALHEIYGKRLVGWSWIENQDLKLIADPETNLEEFSDELSKQINELVLFYQSVTIFLSKEGSGEVKEIHIN